MSLPSLSHPEIEISLKCLGKKVRFRQMVGREEKILLMAKTSSDSRDYLKAILQVVQSCCVDKLDVKTLALADLELAFLKLRAFSVDSITRVAYRDAVDGKVYQIEVDLNEVEVEFPSGEAPTSTIQVTGGVEDITLQLRYPPASLYDPTTGDLDDLDSILCSVVDKVFVGDQVIEAQAQPHEDLVRFLEDLDIPTRERIKGFLDGTPRLRYLTHYEAADGREVEVTLEGLDDFFTLR